MKELALPAVLLLTSMVVRAGVSEEDLVLFLQTEQAPVAPLALLKNHEVRILNDARDGRRVVVAELEPKWAQQIPSRRAHTLEVLVLSGSLDWEGQKMRRYDYAYLPSEAMPPRIRTGNTGVTLLIFLDPPRETDGATGQVVATDATPWRPGVVAQEDTGQALALEVKDLLWVESTGQRTWLLRAGPDLEVPWEVHDSVEEGFLLEGDYRIGECLAEGMVHGDYAPGGYFYRPAGIVHSGPESGSQTGAFWLLRTPTRLTVDFLESCP